MSPSNYRDDESAGQRYSHDPFLGHNSSLVFVRCRGRLRFIRAPCEEFFFLELLPDFCRRERVEVFHLLDLVGREARQLTNEADQMPGRLPSFIGSGRLGGHPRQAYAVLDDIEQLAVRERLRLR